MLRRVPVVILLLLAALRVDALAHDDDDPSENLLADVTVATRLMPTADGERVRTTITIRAKLVGGGLEAIRRLRGTPARFDARYRHEIEAVLRIGRVLGASDASRFVMGMDRLPELRVLNGMAVFSASSRESFPWTLERRGAKLSFAGRDLDRHVAAHVRLRAEGGALQSVSPLPSTQRTQNDVSWDYLSGRVPTLNVDVSPAVYGSRPPGLSQELSVALRAALPFGLLMFAGIAAVDRRRIARRLSIAGIGLAIGWAAYIFAALVQVEDLGLREGTTIDKAREAIRCGVPLFALALAAGLTLRRSPLRGGDRENEVSRNPNQRPLANAAFYLTLILTLAFGVVATSAVYLTGRGSDKQNHGAASDLTTVAVVLATVPIALAVFLGGRWLRAALSPASVARPIPKSFHLGATFVLVVAVLVQLILSAGALADRAPPARFAQHDVLPESTRLMASLISDLPSMLGNVLIEVLTTAIAVLLAAHLWRAAGESELDLRSWRHAFALSLMFGVAVIGLGGTASGYPAPVAFLLGVVLVTVGVRHAAARRRAGVFRSAIGAGKSTTLLATAGELALLQQRQNAIAEPASDDATEQARAAQRAALAKRREEILHNNALDGSRQEEREADILAAGLYGDSSARERLAVVMRKGWWIVAIPAAYGVYSLIQTDGGNAVAANRPIGLAFLAAGILSQVAIWPVAAWAFVLAMPIIPGRHGVIKGAVASAAFIVPAGIAAWLPLDADAGPTWLFAAAELTLLNIALGLLLDYRRLRSADMDLRRLGILYRVTSVRAAVLYAAPVAVLLFTVVEGLATGRGAAALGDLVSNAQTLFPGGR